MKEEIAIVRILNPVACGFPSPAMDYMEQRISLDKEYIKHPLATFFFEVDGFSMINAFIPPKSRLLVDRSITPQNGDIVLASVNGEFVVKFLKRNDFKCWLCSANSKFPDIEITEEINLQVFGVVTTILIETNDVKKCML